MHLAVRQHREDLVTTRLGVPNGLSLVTIQSKSQSTLSFRLYSLSVAGPSLSSLWRHVVILFYVKTADHCEFRRLHTISTPVEENPSNYYHTRKSSIIHPS